MILLLYQQRSRSHGTWLIWNELALGFIFWTVSVTSISEWRISWSESKLEIETKLLVEDNDQLSTTGETTGGCPCTGDMNILPLMECFIYQTEPRTQPFPSCLLHSWITYPSGILKRRPRSLSSWDILTLSQEEFSTSCGTSDLIISLWR